jgi:hypothetical protein
MRRMKHSQPSHTAPPGAAVIKRGEYYEVCFSRRGQRVATLSADKSEALQRSWNFWRVGGNPATHFSNLLTNALK